MIHELRKFDSITAAGILARAALALEDNANPASAPVLANEWALRESVIAELRKAHGLKADDQSTDTLSRLGDYLDTECEQLLAPVNLTATLNRLSVKGELPSDLFNVYIIPNIEQFHGAKFAHEMNLIEETVRSPDHEQHFGPAIEAKLPSLISLFAKTFEDKFPEKSFIMLVAGEREGLRFVVHQAWRVYPGKVDVEGTVDLVDMLRRFAKVYGCDVTLGTQTGSFILVADIPDGESVPNMIRVTAPPRDHVTFSYFTQMNPAKGTKRAALVVGINLDKYRTAIKASGY